MFSHILSYKIIILFSLSCTYTRWGLVCADQCYYCLHWPWTGLCWPVLLPLTLAMDWFVLTMVWFVLTSVTITCTGHGLVCAYWCYYYLHWPWTGLCLLVLLLTMAVDWFVLTSVTTACISCGLVCADRCYYYSHWLWMGLCGLVYADCCYYYYLVCGLVCVD